MHAYFRVRESATHETSSSIAKMLQLCVDTHMCTQQWQGQGSTSDLLHTLPSSSHLGQTLDYT